MQRNLDAIVASRQDSRPVARGVPRPRRTILHPFDFQESPQAGTTGAPGGSMPRKAREPDSEQASISERLRGSLCGFSAAGGELRPMAHDSLLLVLAQNVPAVNLLSARRTAFHCPTSFSPRLQPGSPGHRAGWKYSTRVRARAAAPASE